jgi:formylmethanofuran dehydrogenase subunit E-like metal-binding protein
MASTIPFRTTENRSEAAADSWFENAANAIKSILAMLPAAEQERVLREITNAIRPIPAPRAGEVLGVIVRLLPRQQNWTTEDIKQEIASQGITATAREVYNSIGYLVRKGHIRRIGYGRYLVGGGLLETADDLGGEPARDEQDG